MFARDYKIVIMSDVHDEPMWSLFRKGEPAAANEDEIRMVSEILGKLKDMIDKRYPRK